MIGRINDDLDDLLAALADPTRRHVLEALGAGPRRAGELADAVGMPATTLSRHLQVLRSARLVTVETLDADARVRVYALQPERLTALRAWLDQVEAFWNEQLVSFKSHAERSRPRPAR